MSALVTKVGQLQLPLNAHALVLCLHRFTETILLISSVSENKVLLLLCCILK